MKKLLLIGIVLLLSINFTSAYVEDIGASYKNECIELPQQGYNLLNCTIINIRSPNSSTYATNQLMNKTGDYFYYNFCNTEQVGEYFVNGKCTSYTETDNFVYMFKIIESNQQRLRDIQEDRSTPLILGLGILSAILLFFAFKIDEDHFLFKMLIFLFTFIIFTQIGRFTVVATSGSFYYDVALSFYKLTLWLLRLFITYATFYILYFYFFKKWLIKKGWLKVKK